MRPNDFCNRLHDSVRSGAWLTPERLRVYPVILGVGLGVAVLALFATGHGLKDRWNHRLGADFSGVWMAGREVLAGHPAQPYDQALHAAAQAALFGPGDSYLPWSYAPYLLAAAALVATLPYLVALAVWQATTLGPYVAAVLRAARGRTLRGRDVLVPALAFPAVASNILHGQNGFLSAALLAGGALMVERAPVRAGALFGLLAYKPQFALAIPVALLAGRHWRAIGAAGVTLGVATAATLVVFGPEPWRGFIASLGFIRRTALEMGGLETWKLQSAFAAVRLLGGSVAAAYAVQGLVAAGVLAGLAVLWAGRADRRLKLAGLVAASLLATPYVVDYDMAMLGPALAALVSHGLDHGFPPYGRTVIALAWIAPLVAPGAAEALGLPLGFLSILALFGLVWRAARMAAMVDRPGEGRQSGRQAEIVNFV